MKKIFSLIIVLAMLCTVFTGIGLGAYGDDDEMQIYKDGGFDNYSGVEQLPEWLAGTAPSYNEYGLATISGDVVSSNPGFYVVSPTNNYGQLVGGGVAPGSTVNREFSNMFISVDEEITKEESGQYIFEMDINLPLSSFGDGDNGMFGFIRTGKTPASSESVNLDAVMPGSNLYTKKSEFIAVTNNATVNENGFYHLTVDVTATLAAKVDCVAIYHRNLGIDYQASIDNVKMTYVPTEGTSTVLFNYDFENCKVINDVGIGALPNNESFSGSKSAPIIKTENGDSFLRLSYNETTGAGSDGKSELVKRLDVDALKGYGVGYYEISFDVRTDDNTFDYKPADGEDAAVSATKEANFKLFLADDNFELAMEKPVFSRASGYKGLVSSENKDGWKYYSSKVYLSQYYAQRMSQIVFSLTTGSRSDVYVDIDNVSIVKIEGSGELMESPTIPENSTFYDMVQGGTFEDFAVGNLTNESQNGWSVNVSDAIINGKIAEEDGNKFMRLDCTEKLATGLVAESLVQLDTSLWKVGRVYKLSYDFRITGAETSLNFIQKYLPSGAHVSFFSASAQEYYQQVLLPNGAYDMNANLITSGNAYPITVTDSTLGGEWKHLELTFEIDENFKNQVDCIEFILGNPAVLGGQPQDETLALDFDNFTFGFYRLEGEEINNENKDDGNTKKSGCGSATYGSLLSVAVLAAGFATLMLVRKAKKGE